jgi:hypothetical protein
VRPGLVLGAVGSVSGGVLAWAFGVDGTGRWGVAAMVGAVVLVAAEMGLAVRSRRAH